MYIKGAWTSFKLTIFFIVMSSIVLRLSLSLTKSRFTTEMQSPEFARKVCAMFLFTFYSEL